MLPRRSQSRSMPSCDTDATTSDALGCHATLRHHTATDGQRVRSCHKEVRRTRALLSLRPMYVLTRRSTRHRGQGPCACRAGWRREKPRTARRGRACAGPRSEGGGRGGPWRAGGSAKGRATGMSPPTSARTQVAQDKQQECQGSIQWEEGAGQGAARVFLEAN